MENEITVNERLGVGMERRECCLDKPRKSVELLQGWMTGNDGRCQRRCQRGAKLLGSRPSLPDNLWQTRSLLETWGGPNKPSRWGGEVSAVKCEV